MDPEDESAAYLKLLNEGVLFNGNEVSLNDNLETIFTEIGTADWGNESFPILLSGNLISDNLLTSDKPAEPETKQETEVAQEQIEIFDENGVLNQVNNLLSPKEVFYQIETEQADNQNFVTVQSNGSNGTKTLIYSSPAPTESPQNIYINPQAEFVNSVSIDYLNKNRIFEITEGANHFVARSVEDFFTSVQALKCILCNYLSEAVDEIKSHLNEAHADIFTGNGRIACVTKMSSILNNSTTTLYLCSECKAEYPEKNSLKLHMIRAHNLSDKNDRLPIVNLDAMRAAEEKAKGTFPDPSVLLKKQQKALKRVKCSIKGCSLRFARDDLRKRHEDCHVVENKKQFKCPECNQTFSIWRICTNHLWRCHKIDLGLLTCPMCNKFKSNSTSRVLNHMKSHTEDKPFLCNMCGKRFRLLTQLHVHEHMHKTPEEFVLSASMRKCGVCDRYFANNKTLKKHIQIVHEKFKPFICNICGHQTSRKSMLELHSRQHSGQKPFQCNFCDFKTGDNNSLRRHNMRHLGEKKYQCPHCDYSSIQSQCYKKHLLNYHPGQQGLNVCPHCTFTTVNPTSLDRHLKQHEFDKKKMGNQEEAVDNENVQQNQEAEDDETQHCFFNTDSMEATVDTGGITIPAGLELNLNH